MVHTLILQAGTVLTTGIGFGVRGFIHYQTWYMDDTCQLGQGPLFSKILTSTKSASHLCHISIFAEPPPPYYMAYSC
jgi:hypothetical protein